MDFLGRNSPIHDPANLAPNERDRSNSDFNLDQNMSMANRLILAIPAQEKRIKELFPSSNSSFGNLVRICPLTPIFLTEHEMEYIVKATKYWFENKLVIEYEVRNTVPDTCLCELRVESTITELHFPLNPEVEISDSDSIWKHEEYLPAHQIGLDETQSCFDVWGWNMPDEVVMFVPFVCFENKLGFIIKEIDPDTQLPEENGYEDEYQVIFCRL